MNDPTNNAGRTPCPAWYTTRHRHHGHERDIPFGRASVAVYQLGDRPAELHIWDQSEMPYRALHLDQDGAVPLARVLSALAPEDIIRFAAALAEGASVLGD